MSSRTLLTALFATALTMPALAQPANPPAAQPAAAPVVAPAAAPAAAPAVTVEGAAPTAATVSRDKDTLSVDFPDEDVKTILRNVADLFELNLVVPDTLTGKTSIKLRDVTWRQIFQVVLAPAGYTYIEEGNIIKVVSNELLQQEPGSTEVFVLNNAKAADIKPTIDGLVDAATGGKIVIDARSNALVITERPSRMGRIRTIIEKLDKATDQVMIESKFVEVTDNDIRNIGVNWASLQGMTLSVNNISKTYSKGSVDQTQNSNNANNGTTSSSNNNTSNTSSNQSGSNSSNSTNSGTNSSTNGGNTVTYVTAPNAGITGIPSTTSFPSGTVSGLPASVPSTTTLANIVPGPPVSATALTTYNGTTSNGTTGSTNISSNTNLGDSINNALTNTLSSGANNAINALTSLTNSNTTTRLASAVFSSSDFNVIISALKQNSNTKIVSNPTIVTLNNTEAFLNIGQEFPIPSYTYNSERGTFEVSGFTYKPIGIIMKVTPQVNAQGVIKLALEPEVSQQNGTTSFGGAGGANIPIIATRKVKTQVSLKDGYTAGIGGLITAAKQHGGTSVPILGDIPLLGRLFSSKSINDVTSNLLIFITAKTVNADGAAAEEVFDPRAITALGLTHEDLPGHRAPKGADMYTPPPPSK